MNFKCLFPRNIIFEQGSSQKLGSIVRSFISKPLLITGGSSLQKSKYYPLIIDSLKKEKIEYFEYKGINGEPTPEIIDKVTDIASQKGIDSVISIGGGSVIDTGKAVSGLLTNKKGIENYLEGVGKDYKLENDPLPFVALPTTAGAGAEATKNSVVTSREKKYKKSFRDEKLVARIIIVDPLLTISLPKEQTAYGGMDAICQLIESYVSKKSNYFTSALSYYFLPKAINAILKVYKDPEDINSRSIMCASSLASGLALANAGLGAVHGFASGMGGMFDIAHGLICAVLLPGVCEKNAQKFFVPYQDLASLVNKDKSIEVNKFIDTLYDLNEKLDIPKNFKTFKIGKDFADEISLRSQGSSMSGNPVEYTKEEWSEFIKEYL